MLASRLFSVVGLFVSLSVAAQAQTVQPPFNANYTFTSLGSVPGMPTPYGGITLKIDDPNVLLIGGNANSAGAAIYAIGLTRDACGQISGLQGTATLFASSPNIDGGLCYGPNGVIFASRYPSNGVHQFLPGATSPSRTIDFGPLGVVSSTGAINLVPEGFPGAGSFKIVSWSGGQFYDASLTPDGSGTFNVTGIAQTAQIVGGPEGFTYVPAGSPNFSVPSMIVAEYGASAIGVYDIDSDGNPIASTRRTFMTGFGGAEGAFIDPGTGDFLFGTYGGEVIVVRGFAAVSDCDSVDFNNDGSFFDPTDIDAFLSVFSEGPCVPATATCNDIDFDNNGSCFDPNDIDSFLSVFSEGPCL